MIIFNNQPNDSDDPVPTVSVQSGLKPPGVIAQVFNTQLDVNQHPVATDVTSTGPIDLPAQLKVTNK